MSAGELRGMLDGILGALPEQGSDSGELRASLERLIELSRQPTEVESTLGVAVHGRQAFAFRRTSPRTHREAAHQPPFCLTSFTPSPSWRTVAMPEDRSYPCHLSCGLSRVCVALSGGVRVPVQ